VDQIDQTGDIGDRLKRARIARGLSLSDIGGRTKISPPSLTAMERNDFARLPGGVFRRAYVRAFAEEVGLDAEALVREYRARYEPDDLPVVPAAPRREVAAWVRSWPAVAALAAAGLVITTWSRPGGDGLPGTTSSSAATTAEDDVASAGSPDAADDPAASAGAGDVMFAGGDNDAGAPLRLKLQLSNPSWISVYADGQRVVYRLAQAGESLRVEATRVITLHAGDAGAVGYALNGDEAQPLGHTGQVRTVRFTGRGAEPARPRPSGPPEGVSPVG
jgi:transcriptional regulator with XRE-family HTH domain